MVVYTRMLKRGTPVIINDVDCPEGKLVAVLIKVEENHWKARYLSDYPNMVYCCTTYPPTPLSHFGMKIEWLDDDTYRVVPDDNGNRTATYRDGLPRVWQEPTPVYWKSRKMAKTLLGTDPHENLSIPRSDP